MGQQMANGDVARGGFQIVGSDRPVISFLHLHVAKSGQDVVKRLVELEQAVLHA